MKSKISISLVVALALLPLSICAQILDPVKWNFSSEQVTQSEANEAKTYLIQLSATIDNGWHIYAQEAGDGPIPTTISFEDNDQIKLIGPVEEKGNRIQEYDQVFDSELAFFENEVTFVQKVAVLKSTVLKGSIEFMVCDDEQ